MSSRVSQLNSEFKKFTPITNTIAFFLDMKRSTNSEQPFTIDETTKELSIFGITHWQCLGDAIRSSQLEKISMLDPINEDSSKAIYEALKDNESVHTLLWQDIGSLDALNAKWLAKLIEETESLARLDLICKPKDKKLHETIMRALNKNRSLVWLTIEKIGFKVTDSLKELAVSTSVSKLVLSKNYMNAEQFMALCEGLKHNHSITVLDISHNSVGDEGMRILSEVLKKSMTLRTLNMTALNYTASGLQYLGEALKQNCALKTLKLGEAYELNDGAQFISNALKVNESLTSLKIYDTFSKGGLEVLCEPIKFNRFLMELEFSGDRFNDKCLTTVAEALKINTNIEHLGFVRNQISEIDSLIDMIEHNQSLTSLDISYLELTGKAFGRILEAMQKNFSLLSVDIQNDSVKKKESLGDILERNLLLQYERTLDMLVLFFNVSRNPVIFPKDIWRLIFCYYKTPGVPTFEPLLNDVFQDHSIRRVPSISKF